MEKINEKIIISILAFLLLVTPMVSNIFAMESSNVLSRETIEIVDEYINNRNGLLIISNPVALQQKISSHEFDMVVADIEFANELIKTEEVAIKENGSMYIPSNDKLIIQGGNINGTRLYWWGFHQYNDKNKSKKMVSELRSQAKKSNNVGTKVVAGIIGASLGVIGSVVLSNLPDAIGGGLNGMAKSVEKANKGYGTILAVNWCIWGSNVKSQSSKTK